MSEKFTKEPWEISDMSGVDAMDNFTVCFHIGVSSTGEMIADCQSDNKADYERVKANAHLMKTAPKMYEKLKEIANLFFTISYRMLRCKENKNANAYMRKSMEIQKLLAEARGEE